MEDEWKNTWIEGYKVGRTEGWKNGMMKRRKDGRFVGVKDEGWKDESMEG